MVDDVLGSLDLNPIIATLGQGVSDIVNETAGAVGGILDGVTGGGESNSSSSSSSASKRSVQLDNGILYSISDFSGNAHTNFILSQSGDILSQDLDNNGKVSGSRVAGSYAKDMTFTGHEDTVEFKGESVLGRRYRYDPIHGVEAVVEVFFEGGADEEGKVVGTRILSELEAGGFATVVGDED